MNFHAPAWLPGGHLQTIWSAKWARTEEIPPSAIRRERLETPDGDFIDVDWVAPAQVHDTGLRRPLLILFHGLEGSSASHYAKSFAAYAHRNGMHLALPHFRGCSGEMNRAPRAYHSGDFEEVGWVMRTLAERTAAIRSVQLAVGISLGGNALLRWAVEAGAQATRWCAAMAAVSAPLDLRAGGDALGRGLSRRIYTPMFLRSMKPKALAKWDQFPGLFDRDAVRRAQTLRAFDDAFTAPLHGFKSVDDYWQRASAKPGLAAIRIPSLVLNALNDPFVPWQSLPQAHEVGPCVTLWQPQDGGHVGFARGAWPGHNLALAEMIVPWLRQQADR